MGDDSVRTIGVATVARSDYGIYLPVLRAIDQHPALDLKIIAGGMHLDPHSGHTIDQILADGWPVAARVPAVADSDQPVDIGRALGQGVAGFAAALAEIKPDLLLVLGDRYEMCAAALAALPLQIPVGHIHGGELTLGAMDDALRHAITKLSHLHFASCREYSHRIIQMGEEPWRVKVCGAPGLDNILATTVMEPEELAQALGLPMEPAPLLVTYHPVTLEQTDSAWQIQELFAALDELERTTVFTLPNADAKGRMLAKMVREFCAGRDWAHLRENLFTKVYLSLMAHAGAMVGNSSSGIIEAPSFELPVVNIGARQEGRIKAANIIDTGYGHEEILAGIKRALSPVFAASLQGMENPYGDGRAALRIVDRLSQVEFGQGLIKKRFYDLRVGG